jgi:hypothetical protein
MSRDRASFTILLVALALAVAACGSSSDDETVSTTPAPATTTSPAASTKAVATTATEPAPTTTAPPRETTVRTPQPTTIRIRVVGGKPEGGIARPTVGKNERVVLVVASDTADEVHLHGYDIAKDVAVGGTVRLAFVADTPGRFEVELEDSGVQIAELTIR